MIRLLRFYIVILITTLVVGCGVSQKAIPEGTYVRGGGGVAAIQEVALSDGTRCAVMVGTGKAAISCNWKGN